MKLSFRKMNSAGVTHHALIAVLVISTFASFGAYRVFQSSAASKAPRLSSQGLKANGCPPGQIKNAQERCVAYQQISKIAPECDKYNFQYDTGKKACKTICKTTHQKRAGNCVLKKASEARSTQPAKTNNSPSSTRNNPVKPSATNNAAAIQAVEDSCATQHRPYNPQSNRCENSCIKGWFKKNNRLPCLRNKQAANPASATSNSADSCQTPASKQTARCASSQAPSNSGSPILNDPTDENAGEFRIKVYSDVNFKGDSKTFTSAQASMPDGWNDRISSFKIQKGRWQICQDVNFKKKCVKRWASDADLTKSGKESRNDKISSLRPVTTTTFADAPEDVIPSCKDTAGKPVAPSEDNTCPSTSTLTCPGNYELKDGDCKKMVVAADVAVPVDKSFKGSDGKRLCELLGREWIGKINGKTVNGGEYGCSTETCKQKADGAARGEGNQKYCVNNTFDAPYAAKLEEGQCKELHRVWVNQAGLCAQMPNRKDKNQTLVNAKQCQKSHSTYYIFKSKDKEDECFKPSFFQQARGVAKATGGVFRSALIQGPKAYCSTVKRSNYHWDGEKCVIDRKKCWDGSSVAVTGECPPRPAPAESSNGSSGNNNNSGSSNGQGSNSSVSSAQKQCEARSDGWVWNGSTCVYLCILGLTNNPECKESDSSATFSGIRIKFKSGSDVLTNSTARRDITGATSITVYSGSWSVCDELLLRPDHCLDVTNGMDLCRTESVSGPLCENDDIYIKGR